MEDTYCEYCAPERNTFTETVMEWWVSVVNSIRDYVSPVEDNPQDGA